MQKILRQNQLLKSGVEVMTKRESKNAFGFPFELDTIFHPETFSKQSKWQQEIVSFYSQRLNEYSKLPERPLGMS